ncbi:MAG: Gfo/Idh/MocA family oxidoreductase [Armatimonadota bacterium]|nr:Gfo/Idh/MocA family oxidoreductase [Armatimonadota bacterium]MDR7451835.1 Gfo/Idh/MocA family oxidoreductase [Armatimonadota bacterium]MDR7467560.1 Gfo/Idh/MocA family oxidoreductase [Armatimonadota bacterium]MDR7494479.1 Gfo/Idh/MocA family oxidoreductase [Armatimonadota bacterium]MDR7499740.1 Gfo/Idh/MocA family oxidoreductase [Armatimonadota bacterium]
MTAARVRWGVLGVASIAVRRLIPAIARSQTGVLQAVASREERRAREAAERFGFRRAYGSYEALLADPEVDAVYIPLPNSLHRTWTERAAAAGKHVLCEKPLGITADDARAAVEACARARVVLMEAFMYRFHPQIERMVELVRSGGIGPPWLVRAAFTFGVGPGPNIRLEPTLGGGGLLDVGCYCVNVARLILGEPRTAFAAAEEERGVDVRLAGALRFDGSRMALVDCGLRAPYRQVCEVVGTEGSLLLRRPFQPEEDATEIVVRRARGEPEERIEIPGTNQYVLMVEHFAAVVAGAPARYPPQDAVANMRALDALAAAARTGAPAEVAEG